VEVVTLDMSNEAHGMQQYITISINQSVYSFKGQDKRPVGH